MMRWSGSSRFELAWLASKLAVSLQLRSTIGEQSLGIRMGIRKAVSWAGVFFLSPASKRSVPDAGGIHTGTGVYDRSPIDPYSQPHIHRYYNVSLNMLIAKQTGDSGTSFTPRPNSHRLH